MLRKCFVSILAFWCLSSFAQAGDPSVLERRISITFSNISLSAALRQLNRQEDVRFSYNSNIIPRTTKIISTYSQETLKQILDDLLLEANLFYKEVNGNIVINKRVFNDRKLVGVVVDKESRAPLPFANVFIDNSILGVATGEDGSFEIKNLPGFSFDLVVSYVGYESKMISMQLNERTLTDTLQIEMTVDPKVLEIFTVNAKPARRIERRDRRILKQFEEEFLGRSENSKSCRIVNPDVLDLQVLDGPNHYKVTASDVVFIENQALGYRIAYYLDEFVFENGAQSTKGTARFDELQPKSRKQNRVWENARREAYYGSLPHFLNALIKNELRKEGFQVNVVQFDSVTSEYTTIHNPPAIGDILTLERLGGSNRYQMTARSDIEITYINEAEDSDYIKRFRTQSKSGNYKYTDIKSRSRIEAGNQIIQVIIDTDEMLYQKSVILFKNRKPVILYPGIFSNDEDVQYLGWWNWGGVAEKLPLYYEPRF